MGVENFQNVGKISGAIFVIFRAAPGPGMARNGFSEKNHSEFRGRDSNRCPGDPFRGHFPFLEKLLEHKPPLWQTPPLTPPDFQFAQIGGENNSHFFLPRGDPGETVSPGVSPGSPRGKKKKKKKKKRKPWKKRNGEFSMPIVGAPAERCGNA